MKIESTAFGQNEDIPSIHTCDGDNVSPALRFVGVPEDAVSLAVIADDPDAPSGNWVHWTVWNLPPDTVQLYPGQLPEKAMEGMTSFGRSGYEGPCPPSGVHRYFFKVYALDVVLDIPAGTDVAGLESAMNGHVMDKAGLIGVYSRN